MTPTIRLNHFQRGPVDVQAATVNGRREWTCPDRPMMRPWEDCHFTETTAEIDMLLLSASNARVSPVAKEGKADRLHPPA
jgi:hypothetical protein